MITRIYQELDKQMSWIPIVISLIVTTVHMFSAVVDCFFSNDVSRISLGERFIDVLGLVVRTLFSIHFLPTVIDRHLRSLIQTVTVILSGSPPRTHLTSSEH